MQWMTYGALGYALLLLTLLLLLIWRTQRLEAQRRRDWRQSLARRVVFVVARRS